MLKLILILLILKNCKQKTYQESLEELLYHHNLEDDGKIGNRSLYTYFNGMKLKNDNEVEIGRHIGESLLTSLFTLILSSLAYDLTHRSHGRIYELNANVEKAD